MNFKTYFILKEGGNAFPDVKRIEQKDVPATLKEYEKQVLKKVFGFSMKDVRLLGSALKKEESSGDLDIGVPLDDSMDKFKEYDPKRFLEKVSKAVNSTAAQTNVNIGGFQIYTRFPIYDETGKQTKKFVQVDLMFGDPDYLGFAYHAPYAHESKYKGVYRNLLMMAVAAQTVEQSEKDEEGNVIKRTRFGVNLNKGLMRFKEEKKVKNFAKTEKEVITKDPNEIAMILLGPNFERKDLLTFESIWAAINSPEFHNKERMNDIIEDFESRLKKTKVPFPDEVAK